MKESVAIVTGASQGIGRATAVRLAKDFSGVVLAARNAEALREVAAEVKKTGAESLTATVDLRSKESAANLVNQTLAWFGRIDALVNIAGAVPQIDLFEMTDEQWQDGLELKFHGARRLTILAWDGEVANRNFRPHRRWGNQRDLGQAGPSGVGAKDKSADCSNSNHAIRCAENDLKTSRVRKSY